MPAGLSAVTLAKVEASREGRVPNAPLEVGVCFCPRSGARPALGEANGSPTRRAAFRYTASDFSLDAQ